MDSVPPPGPRETRAEGAGLALSRTRNDPLGTPSPPADHRPFILLPKPAEDPALAPGAASRDQRGGPFKN